MSCPRVLASTSSTGSGNGGLGSYRLGTPSAVKALWASTLLLTELLVGKQPPTIYPKGWWLKGLMVARRALAALAGSDRAQPTIP